MLSGSYLLTARAVSVLRGGHHRNHHLATLQHNNKRAFIAWNWCSQSSQATLGSDFVRRVLGWLTMMSNERKGDWKAYLARNRSTQIWNKGFLSVINYECGGYYRHCWSRVCWPDNGGLRLQFPANRILTGGIKIYRKPAVRFKTAGGCKCFNIYVYLSYHRICPKIN